ncbi:ferritin-like domain-containing protein [Solirubrobacter taibaiensis]|nr:ferritin-like domain-containing protein [Solirubrobacter taibaiensis]
MNRITRRATLETAALALAGVTVGGVVLGEHADPALSRPSAKQDAEILNFALLLEFIQAAFHAEGLQRAKLTGELRTFSQTAVKHEDEHVAALQAALGSAARTAPKIDFGDDTANEDAFSLAALKLEDLGVAAYTAQAPNLTTPALKAAARIVSVESRHAAWIRDIRGMNPAPTAAEPAIDAQRVIDTLKGSGYVT